MKKCFHWEREAWLFNIFYYMSENPKIFNSAEEGIVDIWSVNLDWVKSLDESEKTEHDLKKSLPLFPKKTEKKGENNSKPVSKKSLIEQMRADENDITTESHQTAELDNRSIRL